MIHKDDVEHMMTEFQKAPSKDVFVSIRTWYDNNRSHTDQEYITCVYLFLIGANIRHHYIPMDKQTHNARIKEIRDLIDVSDRKKRMMRKIYLDYGTTIL